MTLLSECVSVCDFACIHGNQIYHDQYVSSHDEKEQRLEQRYHPILKNIWQSRGHLIQGARDGIILDLSQTL